MGVCLFVLLLVFLLLLFCFVLFGWFLDLGKRGVKYYWELVILRTCLVVFLQPDTMTRKGTKQNHPNISSHTLFSQMAGSNLCNEEYLLQSKEIFECDVLKKILKTVKRRPSPTVLLLILSLDYCTVIFFNHQAIKLALNDFHSLE